MNESDLLGNMHELLLEALRSREQEVFKYLGILGPALGGFTWLLYRATDSSAKMATGFFVFGTLGTLLLLFLGALYSLALGYNYRYITLELAKIEARLGISTAMLKVWPKRPRAFLKYRYCTPPDVIKYFWLAFVVGMATVTCAACVLRPDVLLFVGLVGSQLALLGGLYPLQFGAKLTAAARKEIKAASRGDWSCSTSPSNRETD